MCRRCDEGFEVDNEKNWGGNCVEIPVTTTTEATTTTTVSTTTTVTSASTTVPDITCDQNYHLDENKTCVPNVCVCENGQVVKNHCGTHGKDKCWSCNDGFELINGWGSSCVASEIVTTTALPDIEKVTLPPVDAFYPIDTSIIQEPITTKTLYVDLSSGNNNNEGNSEDKPVKNLWKAMLMVTDGTTIFVKNGTYTNIGYGTGSTTNTLYPAVNFKDLNDVKLVNFPGHNPIIRFDGSAGINIANGNRLEIRGFEIYGPALDITKEQALADRTNASPYMNSRGIVIWTGSHIKIAENKVHNAPGCGIRANAHDYVSFEYNEVSNCTWWTSHAEAAMVFAESTNIDTIDEPKLFMVHNDIHDNVNKIPFYAEYMDNQEFMDHKQMEEARPGYGGPDSKFIIDGPGISLTRNSEFYKHGSYEISYNKCYRNGMNGIAIHKTFRVRVMGNLIFDNGKVPKAPAPEDRQPYAGITLNQSEDVIVLDNHVSISDPTDFAYVVNKASFDEINSGRNTNCNGKISTAFEDANVIRNLNSTTCDLTFLNNEPKPSYMVYTYDGLRQHIGNLDLLFGSSSTVLKHKDPEKFPTKYFEILDNNFNQYVEGNYCKGKFMTKTCTNKGPACRDQTYDDCLEAKQNATNNGQEFRGHALIWANDGKNHPWVDDYDVNGDGDMAEFEAHFKWSVQEAVKALDSDTNPLIAWDVLNEAVLADDTGSLRDLPFAKIDNFACKTFHWAYDVLKDSSKGHTKLVYNDYNHESMTHHRSYQRNKSNGVYKFIKDLKDRNCPIDAVGFQSHLSLEWTDDDLEGIRLNIQRYAEIGLEVQITELDVKCCNGLYESCGGTKNCPYEDGNWPEEAQKRQAEIYAKLLEICLEEPNCNSYTVWGFWDAASWIDEEAQDACLYDDAMEPKVNVDYLRQVLDDAQV